MVPAESPPHRPGAAQVRGLWFGLLAAVAAAALCVDFSAIHRFQTGDTLLPVLMSLQKWTPYYWLQDRLGMLLPLLALPLHNPQSNLLAQYFLAAAGSMLAFFLAAIYVAGPVRGVALGALSLALYLLTVPPEQQFFELLWQYQYGLSMALGLGGLLLLRRRDQRLGGWCRVGAAACLLAALWVNIGAVFVLLPVLVASRAALRNRLADRRFLLALALVAAAFAVNLLASRKFGHAVYYGVLSPKLWPACWGALLVHAAQRHAFPTPWLLVLAGVAALGLLSLAFPAYRAGAGRALAGALWLLAGAAGAWLMVGTVYATWYYRAPGRYFIPVALLAQVALVVAAVAPWLAAASPLWQRRLAHALLLGLLLVVLGVYGTPSVARARAGLDAAAGRYSDQVLAAGASHVIGDYWHVWPAVYHANLLLYERGEARRVWGITHRSLPTAALWTAVPLDQTRVAAIAGDEDQVEQWVKAYHLPELIPHQRLGAITVLLPRAALNAPAPPPGPSVVTAAVMPPAP
jgi:hypothetical protein